MMSFEIDKNEEIQEEMRVKINAMIYQYVEESDVSVYYHFFIIDYWSVWKSLDWKLLTCESQVIKLVNFNLVAPG